MNKKPKRFITDTERKSIIWYFSVLLFYGGYLIWAYLDRDTAEMTRITAPEVYYLYIFPIFSFIHGFLSLAVLRRIAVPNAVNAVICALFTFLTVLMGHELTVIGSAAGIILSVLCSMIAKLKMTVRNNSKKQKSSSYEQ